LLSSPPFRPPASEPFKPAKLHLPGLAIRSAKKYNDKPFLRQTVRNRLVSFMVPEQGIGGWMYAQMRPNLGTLSGGGFVWAPGGWTPWEQPYNGYQFFEPLPENLDLNLKILGAKIRFIAPTAQQLPRTRDHTPDGESHPLGRRSLHSWRIYCGSLARLHFELAHRRQNWSKRALKRTKPFHTSPDYTANKSTYFLLVGQEHMMPKGG
jgi:hypothetical protein